MIKLQQCPLTCVLITGRVPTRERVGTTENPYLSFPRLLNEGPLTARRHYAAL